MNKMVVIDMKDLSDICGKEFVDKFALEDNNDWYKGNYIELRTSEAPDVLKKKLDKEFPGEDVCIVLVEMCTHW